MKFVAVFACAMGGKLNSRNSGTDSLQNQIICIMDSCKFSHNKYSINKNFLYHIVINEFMNVKIHSTSHMSHGQTN